MEYDKQFFKLYNLIRLHSNTTKLDIEKSLKIDLIIIVTTLE